MPPGSVVHGSLGQGNSLFRYRHARPEDIHPGKTSVAPRSRRYRWNGACCRTGPIDCCGHHEFHHEPTHALRRGCHGRQPHAGHGPYASTRHSGGTRTLHHLRGCRVGPWRRNEPIRRLRTCPRWPITPADPDGLLQRSDNRDARTGWRPCGRRDRHQRGIRHHLDDLDRVRRPCHPEARDGGDERIRRTVTTDGNTQLGRHPHRRRRHTARGESPWMFHDGRDRRHRDRVGRGLV